MDIRQINRVRKSVNSCWVLIKIGLPYAASGQFDQINATNPEKVTSSTWVLI